MSDHLCKLYESKLCKQRTYVFKCWLHRFKRIPKFCISPHKTERDECRETGDERVWQGMSLSYYAGNGWRKGRTGFVDRRVKRKTRTVYIPIETLSGKDGDDRGSTTDTGDTQGDTADGQ